MKLLIADDQQSLHIFLEKMVNWSSLGITEIRHAYDGKETADIAEQFKPELLIIDVQMPYLNGIQALKQLQQLPHKPKSIILSAYDEFEYAREALRLSVAQYLLKPVDTVLLESAVKELIEEIRLESKQKLQQAITGLIRGEASQEEVQAAAHSAFRLLDVSHYAVFTILGELPDADTIEASFERLDTPCIAVACPIHNQHYVALLVGVSRADEADTLLQLSGEASASWQAGKPAIAITIGASAIGDTPEGLPLLLAQSKQEAACGFYEAGALFSYPTGAAEQPWTLQHYQLYDKAFEEKLSLSFSQSALSELMEEMFSTFTRLKLDPEKVYGICLRYADMAEQIVKPAKQLPENAESITLSVLRKHSKASELKTFFQAWMSSLAHNMDTAADRTEDVINRIRSHVELNYSEDLSLQSVADAFRMDKYQLSRMFKQQIGVNYWQYVMQIRIDKAAELLAETSLKNSAIAEMTGFVDESHFSKTFKKHTGVSPKDYRAKPRPTM